ncbi:MAG: hypothetical protein LH477_14440 [Nocardioides sp.]|nr:hypothetical protein [Nocardioides sp.]
MRISVECGGFTEAADACRAANQVAALVTGSLCSQIAGCGGMAGNDATSSDFARSYDASALEALDALAAVTHAFIGAARLLAVTGLNHANAEAASAGLAVAAYVGGALAEDSFVRVRLGVPPSSLGAQEPALGQVDAWILDQVEGFVWPGADVERLRRAGSAWRRSASSVAGLADHVDAARALVVLQRSPEVPLAVAALDELATVVTDTAWQVDLLATACEDYAAAVEDAHARTRALLAEVARAVVEGVVLSAVVAGISGGLGGGAATAAAIARVQAYAPRFHALLVALRATVASAAARLRTAQDELVALRVRAEKFARVPVRTERGSMKSPLGWGGGKKAGWLAEHEMPPGHTLSDHVGRTVDELVERCRTKGLARSSTFPDDSTAERVIDRALDTQKSVIEEWLRSGTQKALPLNLELGTKTGITVTKSAEVVEQTGVRVVLVPNASMPRGWQILTAYPA